MSVKQGPPGQGDYGTLGAESECLREQGQVVTGSRVRQGVTEDVWIPTYTHLNFHCRLAQGPV